MNILQVDGQLELVQKHMRDFWGYGRVLVILVDSFRTCSRSLYYFIPLNLKSYSGSKLTKCSRESETG